jgi:hypothetical protein
MGWQRATEYGRRNQVETAMFRYKHLIGPKLRARSLPAQQGEVAIAVAVLNRMKVLAGPALPALARQDAPSLAIVAAARAGLPQPSAAEQVGPWLAAVGDRLQGAAPAGGGSPQSRPAPAMTRRLLPARARRLPPARLAALQAPPSPVQSPPRGAAPAVSAPEARPTPQGTRMERERPRDRGDRQARPGLAYQPGRRRCRRWLRRPVRRLPPAAWPRGRGPRRTHYRPPRLAPCGRAAGRRRSAA